MSNSSIWAIDRTLSGTNTPGPSGPGSDGNEMIFRIPQSSSITEASPSDCIVSYQDTHCWGSYSGEEMQSVYFAAPTVWLKWRLKSVKSVHLSSSKCDQQWASQVHRVRIE